MRAYVSAVVAALVIMLGTASANAGGYYVSMGAPGGPQTTYVNGTTNRPDVRMPGTQYRGVVYQPGYQYRAGHEHHYRQQQVYHYQGHQTVRQGGGNGMRAAFAADRAARAAESAQRKGRFVEGCHQNGADIGPSRGGGMECHRAGSVEEYVDGKLVNRY